MSEKIAIGVCETPESQKNVSALIDALKVRIKEIFRLDGFSIIDDFSEGNESLKNADSLILFGQTNADENQAKKVAASGKQVVFIRLDDQVTTLLTEEARFLEMKLKRELHSGKIFDDMAYADGAKISIATDESPTLKLEKPYFEPKEGEKTYCTIKKFGALHKIKKVAEGKEKDDIKEYDIEDKNKGFGKDENGQRLMNSTQLEEAKTKKLLSLKTARSAKKFEDDKILTKQLKELSNTIPVIIFHGGTDVTLFNKGIMTIHHEEIAPEQIQKIPTVLDQIQGNIKYCIAHCPGKKSLVYLSSQPGAKEDLLSMQFKEESLEFITDLSFFKEKFTQEGNTYSGIVFEKIDGTDTTSTENPLSIGGFTFRPSARDQRKFIHIDPIKATDLEEKIYAKQETN